MGAEMRGPWSCFVTKGSRLSRLSQSVFLESKLKPQLRCRIIPMRLPRALLSLALALGLVGPALGRAIDAVPQNSPPRGGTRARQGGSVGISRPVRAMLVHELGFSDAEVDDMEVRCAPSSPRRPRSRPPRRWIERAQHSRRTRARAPTTALVSCLRALVSCPRALPR